MYMWPQKGERSEKCLKTKGTEGDREIKRKR